MLSLFIIQIKRRIYEEKRKVKAREKKELKIMQRELEFKKKEESVS